LEEKSQLEIKLQKQEELHKVQLEEMKQQHKKELEKSEEF